MQDGFRELEHTSDFALEACAADLERLFTCVAQGMFFLAGIHLAGWPRIDRRIVLQAEDLESLLVAFLGELLYISERDRIGFDQFIVRIRDNVLQADVQGAPLLEMEKHIKAVTFHNLDIRRDQQGVHVQVVFDV